MGFVVLGVRACVSRASAGFLLLGRLVAVAASGKSEQGDQSHPDENP